MLYQATKRIIDIVGSIAGLAFTLLLTPFIALAIKFESKGPVFVSLPRVSKGKTIYIHKFRSMIQDAHAMKPSLAHLNERRDGPFFKIRHDPRLTHVGKIIRKFRLDEFPQLWNVLKGELSLVGPRPHEPGEVAHYPERFRHIPKAKAGITGLSQVNGASELPFLKELEYDSYYAHHQSLVLDLKILGKTLFIFFFDPTAV